MRNLSLFPSSVNGLAYYRFALRVSLGIALSVSAAEVLAGGHLSWAIVGHLVRSLLIVLATVLLVVTCIFWIAERLGLLRGEAVRVILGRTNVRDVPSNRFRVFADVAIFCSVLLLDFAPQYIGVPVVLGAPANHVVIVPVLSSEILGIPRLLLNIWAVGRIGMTVVRLTIPSAPRWIWNQTLESLISIVVIGITLGAGPFDLGEERWASLGATVIGANASSTIAGALSIMVVALWAALLLRVWQLCWAFAFGTGGRASCR